MTVNPNDVAKLSTALVEYVTKQYPTVDADVMISALRSAAEVMNNTLSSNLIRKQMGRYLK